jgi:hypothetical protein
MIRSVWNPSSAYLPKFAWGVSTSLLFFPYKNTIHGFVVARLFEFTKHDVVQAAAYDSHEIYLWCFVPLA